MNCKDMIIVLEGMELILQYSNFIIFVISFIKKYFKINTLKSLHAIKDILLDSFRFSFL